MADTPPFDLREIEGGVVFKISIQPRASRSGLAGIHDRALRLRLTAPPVEGAANAACIAFLSDLFQVSKSRIEIVRGRRSRQKWIQIDGMTREMLLKRLNLF